MARRLGAYVSGHPPLAVTITLEGETFDGWVSLTDAQGLHEHAGLDENTPEGQAVLAAFFESVLGPEEYARFAQHRAIHNTPTDLLLDIVGDLMRPMLAVLHA